MSPAFPSQAGVRRGLRLAVIEAATSGGTLASLFAGHDDATVLRASTVIELLQLVGGSQVDAVLLDPELPEGWPSRVAEQVVDGINERVPLMIACRSAMDAKVISDRVNGPFVSVVLRSQLDPRAVVQLMAGQIATKAAKPSAA